MMVAKDFNCRINTIHAVIKVVRQRKFYVTLKRARERWISDSPFPRAASIQIISIRPTSRATPNLPRVWGATSFPARGKVVCLTVRSLFYVIAQWVCPWSGPVLPPSAASSVFASNTNRPLPGRRRPTEFGLEIPLASSIRLPHYLEPLAAVAVLDAGAAIGAGTTGQAGQMSGSVRSVRPQGDGTSRTDRTHIYDVSCPVRVSTCGSRHCCAPASHSHSMPSNSRTAIKLRCCAVWMARR